MNPSSLIALLARAARLLGPLAKLLGPMTKGAAHASAFLFGFSVALAALNLLFTAHSVNASNHQWCALLNTIAAADRRAPPRNVTARTVAAELAGLRNHYGC